MDLQNVMTETMLTRWHNAKHQFEAAAAAMKKAKAQHDHAAAEMQEMAAVLKAMKAAGYDPAAVAMKLGAKFPGPNGQPCPHWATVAALVDDKVKA